MSCHTTIIEILDMLIFSFALVLIETHVTTLDLFLTFLAQRKFYHQDFFRSNSSNQVLFLFIYNTQSPNPTHIFHSFRKFNNLTFFHHQKTLVHFLSLHQIFSPSPRFPKTILPIFLQKLDPQSSWKVFIELKKDCRPSQRLIHQAPFVITCKVTKHTKNINTS